MDKVGKWRAGTAYGPVLSQTDLYLLHCELELNPILMNKHANFHLVFSLVTGQTSGFNQEARDRDLSFTQKDEPATMPRVKQLIIITEHSPWCTIVTNENGVTLNDVCTQVYKEYTNTITGPEFTSIPARVQEQIKRISAHNLMNSQGGMWQNGYYPATPIAPISTDQLKRYDWLRERVFFEGLRKDDSYAVSRLGYSASNVFVMDLSN
ncbi:hypothetical protein J132_07743 [Termitomyces sp. J132]|nr:hypothetical protein H2248_010101 [Termitomyces sp. 'cryptogamus']KNZ77022.1 hypothetical protein J132_07743 [Termitomyces sp. J132]